MLPPDVLARLRCPACGGLLAARTGAIHCESCRRVYPLRDGIPVLIVSESSLADGNELRGKASLPATRKLFTGS